MPYESIAELPAYVKKLPDNKQRQWRSVFNACMRDGKSEGACFKLANGVVKKEVQDWELDDGQELALADEVAQAEKSYQYVDSYEFERRQISQDDAEYNPVGGSNKRACSNCFFFVSPARCTVVSGEIAPNGVSNQWRAVPAYEQVPIPVVIVKSQTKQESILTRVLKSMRGEPAAAVDEYLQIVRQKDGTLRWFARYSNAWEDRDGEIIPEAAHKEYIGWADANKAYPELWFWHTPGTRFGVADWLDFSNGFTSASGVIDKEREDVVDKLKSLGDLGVSHGFLHLKEGNTYTKYRTFEISVLPLKRAAVWSTSFSVAGKEAMMAFSADKRKGLAAVFGEDWVTNAEKEQQEQADRLRALGTNYKSKDELDAEAEAAKAAAPPAVAVTGNSEQVMAAFKAVGDQIGELAKQLGVVAGVVTQLKTDVTTLKTDDTRRIDDAVAAAFATKAAAVTGVARPTESADNVLQALAAKANSDQPKTGEAFIAQMMAQGFGQAVAPNGGIGTEAFAPATVQPAVPQVAAPQVNGAVVTPAAPAA